MLTEDEIKEFIKPGDNIQVVSEDLPGVPGKLVKVSNNSIILGPYEDDELIEKYGEPVTEPALLPIETINLIFKLKDKNNE